jgi:glycosyltransferase involved in cell wall biosynthesis
MTKKIKVLFVVMDFWQAGAERFAYEVDSSLNKDRFDVTILSIRGLNTSKDFEDYYYTRHKALGSNIIFLSDITGANTILTRVKRKLQAGIHKNSISNRKAASFINQFDVINWVGEYAFSLLCNSLDDSAYDKSVIHIMTAKFQGVEFYDNFPKDKSYLFTSGFDDEDQLKFELSEFPNYRHILFPLYLKVNQKINMWRFKPGKSNKKIGIFTRLSTMKPLDPFIYAFHLILDQLPEVELHLFGTGDPVAAGIHKYVEHLGIKNKVFYRGHQEDILETAVKEELDLVWFQGYKNRPAGYAGYDICSLGIPQIFWDFTNSSLSKPDARTVYPIYKNLNLFVRKSVDLLTVEEEAHSLSQLQFNDIVENRNMQHKIHILEDAFLNITLKKAEAVEKV